MIKKALFVSALTLFIYSYTPALSSDLDVFNTIAMPMLQRIAQSDRVRVRLKGLELLDTLAYAYRLAFFRVRSIYSESQPMNYGDWNENIEKEVWFSLGLICFVKDIAQIPKNEAYVKKMETIRPLIVRGAYYQTLNILTINMDAYTLRIEKLPPASEWTTDFVFTFFSEKGLSEIKKAGEKYNLK